MKKITITYGYVTERFTATAENCITVNVSDKIHKEIDLASRISIETETNIERLCKAIVSLEGGIESTVKVKMIECD